MGTQSNALPNLPNLRIFGFRSPHRVGGHGEFPALADDPELGGLTLSPQAASTWGILGLLAYPTFLARTPRK